MRFDVISIFPELIESYFQAGVLARGRQRGLLDLRVWNPRDFSTLPHQRVDDRPFGGGPGMLMMAPPLLAAIAAARKENVAAPVAYLSPQGRPLRQEDCQRFSARRGMILLAGRYEGIDERVMAQVDEEWSLGDYVLAGGELPALVLIEATARLLPGFLGHEASAQEDSFAAAELLDCPHYTRPESWAGVAVPSVLLSGDHARIARWRHGQSLLRTRARRPDLWGQRQLSAEDIRCLQEAEGLDESGRV
ncbi:tRNA (guanosine(37)-N1)-methyltransferase TrmD [Acidithiobacillus acidisediminis]|jgi:tRNA (guanine37-N1)-methyltransferase|uniref:tRNA (guanosine(37)-N1)-methyltransferase TrmD n=1 Tax=Acidithiobacillus TaxID=119977 RepID=UPI00200FE175|nr:tRNA (guanosine(37)-N1)-methyltransferase TrmD [Acidithiobacillus sp. S30A2]